MNTHFIMLVLNCLLIEHNIRQTYLIQNHDIIESRLYTISKTYPLLNHRKTNYGIIISKNKLDNYDPYHKLGKFLGYPTYDQYSINKKYKENGYIFHVKVKLIKNNVITLFSFVAKDLSLKNKIHKLLAHIKETIYDSEYSTYIKQIYIEQLKKRNNKIIEVNFIY